MENVERHRMCELCQQTSFPGREHGGAYVCYNCIPQRPDHFRAALDEGGFFSRVVSSEGPLRAVIEVRHENGRVLTIRNTDGRDLWWVIEDEAGGQLGAGTFLSPALRGLIREASANQVVPWSGGRRR